MSGQLYALRAGVSIEPWWNKAQVASHYGRSTRWVELMAHKGLPSRMIGGRRAYRLSDVDVWLAETFG